MSAMRNFTEDQIMFRDAYRKFLEAEIAPHMEDWREAGIFVVREGGTSAASPAQAGRA